MLRLGLQECLIYKPFQILILPTKIYSVSVVVVSIPQVINIPQVIHSG